MKVSETTYEQMLSKLGEGVTKQGVPLDCMLSESGGKSVIVYLNKIYFQKTETKTRIKL